MDIPFRCHAAVETEKKMKTLIFNGSPRKNGNTASIIAELVKRLDGETTIIRAYDCAVKPCIDCRYCWENAGCAIKDDMQDIYAAIDESDNIVIASPINFSILSGQLLAVLSRLQTYWCAKYKRKEEPNKKKKRGGIILVRGGEGKLTRGIQTAEVLLRDMNAETVGIVLADNSDTVAYAARNDVMEGIRKLADELNRQSV